jgi:predicted DNA repair protein MutK
MASVGLLALIDDIATLLDDVTLMTKVAAKKTAGVLGDDLALNAQQVSGIDASRELPVVWAVAKGSLINKLILVPAALAISAFLPWLVTPLMMLGGLYLCFEGVEKLAHKYIHDEAEDDAHHNELVHAVTTPEIDIAEFERSKIKGAIRTDFILSAEIIVISLGVAQGAPIMTQTIVVSLIALVMTFGVYGLVAGIVKFDDAGLALITSAGKDWFAKVKRAVGQSILWLAPKFMKFLSVVGMLAMFLVGGGILVHGLAFLHHWRESLNVGNAVGAFIVPQLFNAGVGVVAGAVVLLMIQGIKRVVK